MLLNLNMLYNKYNLQVRGVIHIGAHFGNENYAYRNHKIQNKMFFEPLPHTFEVLKKNITDDSILINLALGNSNEKVKMYVERENQGQSSSILKPKLHTFQYPNIKFKEMIEVDMVRLDDFEFDRSKYNFINIDVQGYELEVFKGAKKTLESIDYVMSEVNRGELYENCAMVTDLDKYLGRYGFERVETTWDGGSWGDAFYIKKQKDDV